MYSVSDAFANITLTIHSCRKIVRVLKNFLRQSTATYTPKDLFDKQSTVQCTLHVFYTSYSLQKQTKDTLPVS